MAMKQKDQAAFDTLRRAVRSCERKTGETLFACGSWEDMLTKEKRFIALGLEAVLQSFLEKRGNSRQHKHSISYPKPNLSTTKWWTSRKLRQVIPILVKMSKKNEQPQWGREEDRPEWWPVGIHYISPRQHL